MGQVGTGRWRQPKVVPGFAMSVSIPMASGALAVSEGTLRRPQTRAHVLEGGVNPRHRRLRRRRAGRPGCAALCAGLVPRNSLSDNPLLRSINFVLRADFGPPNF
jgi:hypothetical protein